MSAPMIYQFLWDGVDPILTGFITGGATSVMDVVRPIGMTFTGVYVVWWAIGVALDRVSEPLQDGIIRLLRMAIIITIAFTGGYYLNNIVPFALNAPSELATAIITSGAPSGGAFATPDSVPSMLDEGLGKGWEAGFKLFGIFSMAEGLDAITALPFAFVGILVLLISLIFTGIAAALLFTTQIALSILLALGPLFIMLAIWESTTKFFEAWVAQTANFMLLFVIVGSVLAITFTFYNEYADLVIAAAGDLGADSQINEALWGSVKLVGFTILCGGVFTMSSMLASGLAGGIAASMGGVAGMAARAGMAGVSGAAGAVAGSGSSNQRGRGSDNRGLSQARRDRFANGKAGIGDRVADRLASGGAARALRAARNTFRRPNSASSR